MSLRKGQHVTAEILQYDLIVQEKLGEGGQGEVYRVIHNNQHSYALKWYNTEQSTPEQKKSIQELVSHGAPHGAAGKRFIWPLDIVTTEKNAQFGYLMPLIDTQRFAELGEIQAHRKPAPSFATLCEISYQIANSYRMLHLDGYCYRDISAGNVMFDAQTGETLICDNDNVGINSRDATSQVWGTMEYMAPEVIRGQAKPSIETDQHSLAVLLFNLWVWHHPMHGDMEYQIYVWDLPAKKRIYGENPVFIFDPNNTSNQLPSDAEYHTARKRWQYCPSTLQALFTRAFSDGLHHPAKRVTEGEWQDLFLELKDNALRCPHCHAENLWSPPQNQLACWHCQTTIPIPPKLSITHTKGKHTLLLHKETQLLQRHIQPHSDKSPQVIGEVVQNPNNPNVWGIRNLTDYNWTATLPNGQVKTVEPQRAAPLSLGLRLEILAGVAHAEIIA
ncbi:serine/threonine protein kinase [Beggiatoa leptomitoformis]|uniref:mitogen-activated protein kinase kinase n=1 Tax=Beggiatoa leptomitoformis TaxID=288004 RepID=A0A2N9YHD4_9GAMM|nr:serine/threonine-protein kinase [Beggiatoa leptomitoformis]ALG67933.1 protein kinase [Beggiatoa leptomitoformis]AUI69795.1 protein kinase [Beggiatoa leptomitoformis]